MLDGLLNGNSITEKRIVEMMLADYSWEQVVYDIIASQGMDPWNLNLNLLSQSFLSYMKKIEELDFRIPAKYIIISSVILRMKSDNMRLLDIPSDSGPDAVEDDYDPGQATVPPLLNGGFNLALMEMQQGRRPVKQLMISDLILALRKVMGRQEIRKLKMAAAREKIKISSDSIIDRINNVYNKINNMLANMKKEEIPFSNVVEKWERSSVVKHFLPIVYLNNEKKIECRQEDFFEEIYISKNNQVNNTEAIPEKKSEPDAPDGKKAVKKKLKKR